MFTQSETQTSLHWQRLFSRITGPLWIAAMFGTLRALRYRIRDVAKTRAQFREILAQADGPLLLCANHLTYADSVLLAWALGSGPWFALRHNRVPWNVPDRENFASPARALAGYLMKCIMVERGGDRDSITATLERVAECLNRREPVLMFPEGGRNRSERLSMDATQYGVGRIFNMADNCSVLCLYQRGDAQQSCSTLPRRGDTIHVSMSVLKPSSESRGMRADRDIAKQIMGRLIEMEGAYFAARQ